MTFQLQRYEKNPVLTPRDNDWERLQVRNPAACYDGRKVHLVYSARAVTNTIHLGLAESDNGYDFRRVGEGPWLSPSAEGFDAGTIEDARMVNIEGVYYIVYGARAIGKTEFANGAKAKGATSDGVTWTRNFRRGGLLATRDFKTVERLGPISSEHEYDCNFVLFPEKVNGRYVLLHRPSAFEPFPNPCLELPWNQRLGIHICYSRDLVHWEDDRVLIRPEQEWEETKVGGSTQPIRTPEGWLTLYHGVQGNDQTFVYRVGVMLLDLKDPSRVIARSPHFILEPETAWEREGTVNNVVFPNGAVVIGDTLFVYYGGADTVCGVATAPLRDVLSHVLTFRR
jgi:predicted GH43/DUF377 family glycosyl hydrolase